MCSGFQVITNAFFLREKGDRIHIKLLKVAFANI